MAETEIEMVRRHIRDGERHLSSQRRIAGDILARGADAHGAYSLLILFEGVQEEHKAHLVRLTGVSE